MDDGLDGSIKRKTLFSHLQVALLLASLIQACFEYQRLRLDWWTQLRLSSVNRKLSGREKERGRSFFDISHCTPHCPNSDTGKVTVGSFYTSYTPEVFPSPLETVDKSSLSSMPVYLFICCFFLFFLFCPELRICMCVCENELDMYACVCAVRKVKEAEKEREREKE